MLEQEEYYQQQDIDDQIADFETWEHSLAAAAAAAATTASLNNNNNNNRTTAAVIEQQVVCPICCESLLQQQSQSSTLSVDRSICILCPNDACPFYLGPSPPTPSSSSSSQHRPPLSFGPRPEPTTGVVSLADLKNRLRLAFENHSRRCLGTLTFEMQPISYYGDDHHLVVVLESQQQQQQPGECLVGSCEQCGVRLSIT